MGRIGQRLRVRALAGDARAGSWARARARTEQRDFVRQHWLLYLISMMVLLAITVAVSLLMPTGFLKGLVVGGFLVAGAAALWSLTVQVTGTAPVMMGETAEQWTAAELRRLRSRGWRVVNHFVLARDDIDHVLVGPGGLYVVETKWSASSWRSDFGRSRLEAAITQATANARSLRLWHPIKSASVPAHAVVVVWGGSLKGRREGDQIRRYQDTTVVPGAVLSTWVRSLGSDVLAADQVERVWKALDAQVAMRDPLDRATHPVPLSVAGWLVRLGLAIGSAICGVLYLGQLIRITGSTWQTLGLGAAALALALAGTRVGALRFAAWGWLLGLGLPLLAVAIAEALYGFPA